MGGKKLPEVTQARSCKMNRQAFTPRKRRSIPSGGNKRKSTEVRPANRFTVFFVFFFALEGGGGDSSVGLGRPRGPWLRPKFPHPSLAILPFPPTLIPNTPFPGPLWPSPVPGIKAKKELDHPETGRGSWRSRRVCAGRDPQRDEHGRKVAPITTPTCVHLLFTLDPPTLSFPRDSASGEERTTYSLA